MINGPKACRSRLWLLLLLSWASAASAQPHITQQPALTNSLVQAGSDVTLRVGATGSGVLGFHWRLNGVPIPGAASNIFSLTNIQAAQGGTYDVGVKDSEGVVFSDVVPVVVDGPVLSFSDNFNAVNGKNGSFTNTLPTNGTNRYSGSGRGSNVSATREANEPFHAGKHGKTSVWLTWQPKDDGVATIDTKGSGFDTLLAVYTGDSLTNLTAVTANDDTGGYLTSLAVFNADSKTEYHIAVDGQAGEKGDIVLNWKLEPVSERVPEIITEPKGHSGHKGTNVALSVGFTNNVPVTVQWLLNG
ncbi:MAG: immunoglobulin domain-containing protein, partial [Limisphaerales bacterium]